MMEINIRDDFDLDKIADSGQCFRWEKEGTDGYRIIHAAHFLKILSYILDNTEVAKGRLHPETLMNEDDEAAIRAPMSVCGVGVKVANCVSLFGLHHIDSFPVDVWIRRILDNEYPAGYPYEKYRPYNGIYQQYMFYYYRNRDAVLSVNQ